MTAGTVETIGLRVSFEDDASRQLAAILGQYNRFEDQVGKTTRALKRQSSESRKLRGILAGLGGAAAAIFTARTAAAIARWVDSSREATVAAFDLGNRVRGTTEFISEFTFVAKQNGIEAKVAASALTALGRRAAALPQNFERWGIATRDVNGELLDSEQLLDNVANRVQQATSQAERLAIADETLSEAGRKLVPVLQDGAAGLATFREQAQRAGATISTETASRIKLLDDTITDLNASADKASRILLSALAPTLTAVAEEARKAAGAFNSLEKSAVLPESFVQTLEFVGQSLVPGVILTVSTLSQAFTVLRGILGGISAAWATATTGTLFFVRGITEAIAVIERFAGVQDGFFTGVSNRVGQLQRDLFGFAKEEGKLFARIGEDVAAIGTEARQQAAQVVAATGDIAARARQIIREGGARPGGGGGGGGGATPTDTQAAQTQAQREAEEARLRLEQLNALRDAEIEIGAIREGVTERILALQMSVREQERAAFEERIREAQQTGTAFGRVFGQILVGQQSVEQGLLNIGNIVLQEAFKFISAEAAKAAAAAFTSQAGIPIIGPLLGAAAAAAAFTAVSAFAGTFHDGGIVGAQGRIPLPPDVTRPLGPDERFARVRVGEQIIPASATAPAAAAPTNVFLTLQSLQNPGRAAFARTTETDIMPAIQDAVQRGATLEPRNVRGRFLR